MCSRERDKSRAEAKLQEAAKVVPDPAEMAALEAIVQRLDAQLSDDADSDESWDMIHNTCLDADNEGAVNRDTVFLSQFEADRENNFDELTFEEAMAAVQVPNHRDICNAYNSDELSEMIGGLSDMCVHITQEEHADTLLPLLILREEARYYIVSLIDTEGGGHVLCCFFN